MRLLLYHCPMVTFQWQHQQLGQGRNTGHIHGATHAKTEFTTFAASNSHENTFAPSVLHCTLGTSIHILYLYVYVSAFSAGILLKNKQFYSNQFPIPKSFQFCSAALLPPICSGRWVTRDGTPVEAHGKVRLGREGF